MAWRPGVHPVTQTPEVAGLSSPFTGSATFHALSILSESYFPHLRKGYSRYLPRKD